MRILVVDDDVVFREELAELLRDDGHEVAAASSVPKAVEALTRDEVDVVLTDLKMPRHGGLELLREVRRQWPRTLVVLITGFASVDTALEAMKAGAFDYLRKPFRIEQLRGTLELASQERAFAAPPERRRAPAAEARELARSGEFEVLYLAEAAPRSAPHLHFEPLDPTSPAAVVDRVREFVGTHARSAVVVAGVDRLLERHRLEDVVAALDQIRLLVAGRGPLRVSFDPARISPEAAAAVASAVASEETQGTLDALANPIRRRALQRARSGPATFSQLMEAAGLDDSPKMSFHVRKLVDAGLLRHESEEYRLTTRGTEAVGLLTDATLLAPPDPAANRTFAEPTTSDRSDEA